MSNNVDLVVQVLITRSSLATRISKLDLPLIFAKNTPNTSFGTNRSKLYTPSGLSDVATDWGSSSDEYKAISALFSADKKLSKVRVAIRDVAVATVKEIVFSGALTLITQKIQCVINGTVLTDTPFDTDMATTLGNLRTKVLTAIGINTVVVGTNKLTITATAEYSLDISASVNGTPTINTTITTTTAGRSIVDDYLECQLEVNDWYMVLCVDKNNGVNHSLARQIQTELRQFQYCTNDSDCKDLVTTDIFSKMKNSSLGRTSGLWHHDPAQYPEFAWIGECLPDDPGSISFANKKLNGITSSDHTVLGDSAISNIIDKKGNVYMSAGNAGITWEGRTFDGNTIANIRDIDFFQLALQNSLFDMFTNVRKLPFTKAGITTAQLAMDQVFKYCEELGILSTDVGKKYILTMPELSSILQADKDANLLDGTTFTAYLANEIIKIRIEGKILL